MYKVFKFNSIITKGSTLSNIHCNSYKMIVRMCYGFVKIQTTKLLLWRGWKIVNKYFITHQTFALIKITTNENFFAAGRNV